MITSLIRVLSQIIQKKKGPEMTKGKSNSKPKIKDTKSRQAVIVIHGIGEQRPMDTLKSFVKNLVSKKVRNKPDKMSTSFELRRLQVPGGERYESLTDFYEYYWAHHMRDTQFRQVLSWVRSLLFRKPRNVSKKLRPFYYALWIGFLPSLCWFSYLIYDFSKEELLTSSLSLLWIPGVLLVDYLFLRIAYGTIDDAARYLNPSPDNIEQRNKIRKEGIELLDSLHKSKKYRRVVVVGHSLGSVIAYDLLRLYWSSLEVEKKENRNKQEILKAFESKSNSIFADVTPDVNDSTIESQGIESDNANENENENEKIEEENKDASIDQLKTEDTTVDAKKVIDDEIVTDSGIEAKKTKKYQELQLEVWRELRESNWPWLVTDFITIGSPLAHGGFLLARDEEEFTQLKEEGEYPCCPPVKGHNVSYKKTYETNNGKITSSQVPTHLVPFMCTRWSNIYFPHRKLIKGDLVGGPLQSVFGKGVKDIPVGISGYFNEYWNTHIKYWIYDRGSYKDKNKTHPSKAIEVAMNLEPQKRNKQWPEP